MIEQNCKTFEYCPIFPSDEELITTVVAFSNTSGGEILIHIGEELDPFKYYDMAKLTIERMSSPKCNYKILLIAKDKIQMISIKVTRSCLLPVCLVDSEKKKRIYIRENDVNILIESDKDDRFSLLRAERRFDKEVNKQFSMKDLNLDSLARKFKESGLRINKEELQRLSLIGSESDGIYPTNALLAITGNLNSAKIRCSYYTSEYHEIMIDSTLCKGEMMTQIMIAEEFIEQYMPKHNTAKSRNSLIRHSIPFEAIREGLLNAVIHRDYSRCEEIIEVKLYDKSLKIISPGGFTPEITQDDIGNGYSLCRNPNIARICKELKIVDGFGGGINRIISRTNKFGLVKPTWQEKHKNVELTLFRLMEEKGYPYIKYDLSDQEQAVITFLVNHSYRVCTEDVKKICSVKERAARNILASLASKDCIEKVSRGPSTFYKAILRRRQNPI